MSRETAQTYVAWCPRHGIPLNEAKEADGWNWCPSCRKLYRVIISDGKVTIIEDSRAEAGKSRILSWLNIIS